MAYSIPEPEADLSEDVTAPEAPMQLAANGPDFLQALKAAAAIRAAKDKAQSDADYQKALMEREDMKKAGKTDSEITRELGPRLYRNPRLLFEAEKHFNPPPVVQTNYAGQDYLLHQGREGMIPQRVHPAQPTVPLDVRAGQAIRSKEMDSAQRDLDAAKKASADDPQNVAKSLAVSDAGDRLDAARKSFQEGSTNWMGRAAAQPPIVAPTIPIPPTAGTGLKVLDADTARSLLKEAAGDKNKARALARERGYTF